jgi:hypothetical protein
MENLKQSFFVVRLHSPSFAREAWWGRERQLVETNSVPLTSKRGVDFERCASRKESMHVLRTSQPHTNEGAELNEQDQADSEGTFALGNMFTELDEPADGADDSISDADGRSRARTNLLQGDLDGGADRWRRDAQETEYFGEIPDTTDPDDVMECESFDTRQSFLDLCSTNHFQFDQLRRAKHSSMMVLFYLHTPSAPKLLPTCGNCLKEIAGSRFHCDTCESFDLCEVSKYSGACILTRCI